MPPGRCPRCKNADRLPGQGYCAECRNAHRRERYRAGGDDARRASREASRKPAAKWSNYRSSARRRGIEWSLLRDEFVRVLTMPCHWCGGPGGGVDRVSSQGGYVSANVVSCCGPCNRMKGVMPAGDWIDRCVSLAARWGCSDNLERSDTAKGVLETGCRAKATAVQRSLFPAAGE